jgi:hypothetical protein
VVSHYCRGFMLFVVNKKLCLYLRQSFAIYSNNL